MSELSIMIPDREAVCDFVAVTSKLPFDMDIVQGSKIVDAKSILGVIYMGLGKVLSLKVRTENLADVKTSLKDFIVE
ncbi:HPr family phosphocarrier protein [Oribacterium sp. P6A1]|uniref:HPr family phosphocarrier protein n=1 Tax=Oribacterium sp. P6A1 TaxID=1410612 RepID=UPI00055A542B|nr:HPr family phosphocarrier protein [Oribacterium sp. P6A1]